MIDITQVLDGTPPNTGVAVTTTRPSTNVFDLLAARDVGVPNPLGIHVVVTETFAGGTSLVVAQQVCATEGGTYLTINQSALILTANLIAGQEIYRVPIVMNQANNQTSGIVAAPGRYFRLLYTVVGTNTAGAVFAYVNPNMDRNAFYAYPSNYTVYVDPDEI